MLIVTAAMLYQNTACYKKLGGETFLQCPFNSIVPPNLEMFSVRKECKPWTASACALLSHAGSQNVSLIFVRILQENWDFQYWTKSCQQYSRCTIWIMFFQTMQRHWENTQHEYVSCFSILSGLQHVQYILKHNIFLQHLRLQHLYVQSNRYYIQMFSYEI